MISPLLGVHGRPDIKAPGLDEARAALADPHTPVDECGGCTPMIEAVHLAAALTAADRLATENARLREALASLADSTDEVLACGLDWDPTPYAEDIIADARSEVANARRILAEVRDGK